MVGLAYAERAVIFVTVHRLHPNRVSPSRPRVYKGVLLGWPRDGAPMVVLLHGDAERTLTTSNVRRVLHDGSGALQMFVETRNNVYRVVCAAGSEPAWKRETARVLAAQPDHYEQEGSTDVREPNQPIRIRRPSRH